jgi:hypothetical protein
MRSPAKRRPAMAARRTGVPDRGPYRRRSTSATAARIGRPNRQRNTVAVEGDVPE